MRDDTPFVFDPIYQHSCSNERSTSHVCFVPILLHKSVAEIVDP